MLDLIWIAPCYTDLSRRLLSVQWHWVCRVLHWLLWSSIHGVGSSPITILSSLSWLGSDTIFSVVNWLLLGLGFIPSLSGGVSWSLLLGLSGAPCAWCPIPNWGDILWVGIFFFCYCGPFLIGKGLFELMEVQKNVKLFSFRGCFRYLSHNWTKPLYMIVQVLGKVFSYSTHVQT